MNTKHMFDDKERNHFTKKKKKEKYEDKNTRATFLLHPELNEILQFIRIQKGNKKGFMQDVFARHIHSWIEQTPVEDKLSYAGIKDVTDSYKLTTILVENKLLKTFEEELGKIYTHKKKIYGIKTEIINEILLSIIKEEGKGMEKGIKKELDIVEYAHLF